MVTQPPAAGDDSVTFVNEPIPQVVIEAPANRLTEPAQYGVQLSDATKEAFRTEWGYARVSTTHQSPDLQLAALQAAGIDPDHLVVETASGARTQRPALDHLLDNMEAGDRLTIWRLDRLGRSLSHLVGLVDDLRQRGIALRSLHESIDTGTSSGRLMFHVFAALAEFERELTRERTTAALAVARERGKPLGRPSPITAEQAQMIRRLDREGLSHARISRSVGVSRAGVGRLLRGEIHSHNAPSEPTSCS